MDEHPVLKHFERIEHSKQWPSSDPVDYPYITYKCKKCNWMHSFLGYGSFPIGFNPQENALSALHDHLLFDHK